MKVVFRERLVAEYSRGKVVLDLGSVGNETFEDDIRRRRWLFARIQTSAAKAIGVDLQANSIARLRQRGFDIRCHDLQHLESFRAGVMPDPIVAGELIEHLDNMAAFLAGLRAQMGPRTELLITTPNPFGFIRFVDAPLARERARADHLAWYSAGTLHHLLESHGFRVKCQVLLPYEQVQASVFLSHLRRWAFLFSPSLSDGLIVIAMRDDAPCGGC